MDCSIAIKNFYNLNFKNLNLKSIDILKLAGIFTAGGLILYIKFALIFTFKKIYIMTITCLFLFQENL